MSQLSPPSLRHHSHIGWRQTSWCHSQLDEVVFKDSCWISEREWGWRFITSRLFDTVYRGIKSDYYLQTASRALITAWRKCCANSDGSNVIKGVKLVFTPDWCVIITKKPPNKSTIDITLSRLFALSDYSIFVPSIKLNNIGWQTLFEPNWHLNFRTWQSSSESFGNQWLEQIDSLVSIQQRSGTPFGAEITPHVLIKGERGKKFSVVSLTSVQKLFGSVFEFFFPRDERQKRNCFDVTPRYKTWLAIMCT